MNDYLQANGIRYTKTREGYAAYMTDAQFSNLWRQAGVAIVESHRAPIRCFMRRVTWGLWVRWTIVEARPVELGRVAA